MTSFKFKMFAVMLVAILTFASITSVGAAPKSGVTVTLKADQPFYTSEDSIIVHVSIQNTSKNPVKVLKWYTPAEDVEEALFTVSIDGGQQVEYTGAHYKRPAATGNDYMVLHPGEILTRDVDLAQYYDFAQSGIYSVSYDVASWNLFDDKSVGSLSSNRLDLSIEGRFSVSFTKDTQSPSLATITGGTSFSKCTASQQASLNTARNEAANYAENALSYLNANTLNQPTQRYTTWFGSYLNTRYSTATSHFSAISNAFNTQNVKFDCGCKKTYYAYVYPSQPYTIYLCKAFWTAPMTGTDSKAGTLIHEMSHFNVVAGTDDWVYGQAGAQNLAISNPDNAVDNADNHEYFAENTPAQP